MDRTRGGPACPVGGSKRGPGIASYGLSGNLSFFFFVSCVFGMDPLEPALGVDLTTVPVSLKVQARSLPDQVRVVLPNIKAQGNRLGSFGSPPVGQENDKRT